MTISETIAKWFKRKERKLFSPMCGCGNLAIWIYPVGNGSYVYCADCHVNIGAPDDSD